MTTALDGLDLRDLEATEIDHETWSHRPFRADDWLLDGGLALSVAREGLVRPFRSPGEAG